MTRKQRENVRNNVKTIRHYLELSRSEFADKTGLDKARCSEMESRFMPTNDEIEKIAAIAEIKASHIVNHRLYLKLEIA